MTLPLFQILLAERSAFLEHALCLEIPAIGIELYTTEAQEHSFNIGLSRIPQS